MHSGHKIFFVLALAFASGGASAQNGSISQQLTDHKAKAERMHPHDRGQIYAEIAHELVDIADQQYANNEFDKAEASIKEAAQFAERAVAATQEHHKKMKETEINLRKCERRLEELRRSLAVDDQPPVKSAEDRVIQLRKDLLAAMFAPDKK